MTPDTPDTPETFDITQLHGRQPSASPAAAPTITIVGKPRGYAGYVDGHRQPSLQLLLHVAPFDAALWPVVDATLDAMLAPGQAGDRSSDIAAVVAKVSQWVAALEQKAGMPVFERGRQVQLSAADPSTYALLQPCLDRSECLGVFRFVVGIVNRVLAGGTVAGDEAVLHAEMAATVERVSARAPRGFNSLHFLQAASDLGIPWARIIDNVFQFGWGARSQWLSSSFTESTSSLATKLARNKLQSAVVLRDSGLPVPRHRVSLTQDDAVGHAEALGYPVVVKPANLDGGQGVSANLKTAAAVRKAFDEALALSERVLVEQHIAGRDYRLHVVHDQVQGVLEREPGSVTGNGVDSVRALLAQQNLERRTASDDRRFLKEMALDDEALEQLAECGMNAESVPAPQQRVRLRGAANVASGGIPVPLPPDRVHPDNLQLAVRAAQALRLDVAGVDLLMPDIAQSWRDVGGAICEVNAQPQMFSTMHRPMLQKLVGTGLGRIPTVVVLGDAAPALGRALQQALMAKGRGIGWLGGDQVWIDGQCLHRGRISTHQGGTMLLRDRNVYAVVLTLSDARGLEQGWPIDRCSVLVLPAPPAAGSATPATLVAQARTLQPVRVIVDASADPHVAVAHASFGGDGRVQLVEQSAQASAPWQALTDATLRALGLGGAAEPGVNAA